MREEGWKRIYGKKASGETGVSWDVSGWCESFPFADEAGWQRAYSGICSGSRRMAQKHMYSGILTQNLYFPAHIFENPGEAMLGGESFMVPGNTDSYLTRPTAKLSK